LTNDGNSKGNYDKLKEEIINEDKNSTSYQPMKPAPLTNLE